MIYLYALNIGKISGYKEIADLEDIVSEGRKKRIERYRFEKDKIRCLVAELLVRYALFRQYDLYGSDIVFGCGDSGKPFLTGSEIRFNISHSGEWVVCAVGDSDMGIDVEEIKAIDFRSVYQRFSEREVQFLDSIEDKALPFYRIWTLKESYVKYNGFGLRCPFESFAVIIDENEKTTLVKEGRCDNTIRFVSSKLDDTHWQAVCMETTEKISEIMIITVPDLEYALFGQDGI